MENWLMVISLVVDVVHLICFELHDSAIDSASKIKSENETAMLSSTF